jgi:malonyl-ACP decarboxylase
MKNYDPANIVITGAGIITAAAQGKEPVMDSLLQGQNSFAVMQRPGRQHNTAFLGAEIPEIVYPSHLSKKLLRSTSLTGGAALAVIDEAWQEARLFDVAPERIGLITGGSNIQQRELMQTIDAYREKPVFIRPAYGLSFMDTDICGLCTEVFNIRGMAYTVGGASASGQLAILQAFQAVQSGQVDMCIALGALMDVSFWELQALRTLGAMGSLRYAENPPAACRPFDQNRDGFIYGECCGAIVIERIETAIERQVSPYAAISGWAMAMDGNRNPNPSYDGECAVIRGAMKRAGIQPRDIDYVNPHGSGSLVGDETELQALRDCRLAHAFINTTKSITGHGLSAAGMVEVIATLLQMKRGKLHPSRNLEEPVDPSFNWVREQPVQHEIKHALSLSFGFGGINTALCLRRV